MTTLLSPESILDAVDFEEKEIEVEEWGGTIRIRSLSADEAISFLDTLDSKGRKTAQVRIVQKSIVNAEGNLMFGPKDLEKLRQRNMRVINRIATHCLEINGMTDTSKGDEGND